MKKFNRLAVLALLAIIVSLLMAACGDPTPTNVTTPVATTPANTTAATTTTVAQTTAATTAAATTAAATTAAATTAAATTAAATTVAATTAGTTAATSATTVAATTAATTTPAPTVAITNGSYPPILFVHGNGDYAALWVPTIWRFESNGWPRDRLFAIDYPYPTARDADTVAQPSRSSTEEQKQQLSAKVDEILAKTGASKIILIGNSRGGNSIRNYVKNGGGSSKVSHVILGGAVNHGVGNLGANSEFSTTGTFITGLNSGPNEVVDGVAFLTIRSDKNDKYAQPGAAGYEGPALKGATNVVLEGIDHRETAYSPQAFAEMWKFLMGKAPESTEIKPEATPKLSGLITGYENKVPTNKGVAGVEVSVFEVDSKTGARLGAAVHQATTEADGSWGSFTAKPDAYYEFVVKAPNMPVMHFFRSPFPRSSDYVTMRLAENPAVPGKSVIYFTRPRGYVATGRDTHLLDGKPVPGVKSGVPTDATFKVEIEGPERAVPVTLNKESMTVRAIPDEVVYAEFQY